MIGTVTLQHAQAHTAPLLWVPLSSSVRALTECCVLQMLFPHSGRHGFDQIEPDATVLTPSKDVVVAMLKRETELRNDRETQELLDKIQNDPDEQDGQEEEVAEDNETVDGKEEKEEKEPETLEVSARIFPPLAHQTAASRWAASLTRMWLRLWCAGGEGDHRVAARPAQLRLPHGAAGAGAGAGGGCVAVRGQV